jgi:hypothetical protein
MNKQEFLAMSLLYGLKFAHFHCGIFNKIADINGSLTRGYYRAISIGLNNKSFKVIQLNHLNDYKPILHPLSDLTKEIEHNGEKFVPIVELAKIAYSKLHWKCGIEGDKCFLYSQRGNKEYQFLYCQSEQSFSTLSIPRNDTKYVPYCLQLFQKLIEWKFDIAGLIEKGEAIDVNSLSENPYK